MILLKKHLPDWRRDVPQGSSGPNRGVALIGIGGGGLGAEIPAVGRNNYLKQMLMTENVIPSALSEKKKLK